MHQVTRLYARVVMPSTSGVADSGPIGRSPRDLATSAPGADPGAEDVR